MTTIDQTKEQASGTSLEPFPPNRQYTTHVAINVHPFTQGHYQVSRSTNTIQMTQKQRNNKNDDSTLTEKQTTKPQLHTNKHT